jgi:hypothetical protein
MRDPARIVAVQLALIECWSKFPDMRFGQLVFNIHRQYSGGRDMFYIEDDQWLEWIEKFQEEYLVKFM